MGQIINVCVIKKDELIEYTGTIDVSGDKGINVKCIYTLSNVEDASEHLTGEFICQYPVLSRIISTLDGLINTV